MKSPTANVIKWLRSMGFDAHQDVPAKRPARFVTVEQVGGRFADTIETANLAIQFWDSSWQGAEESARRVLESVDSGSKPDGTAAFYVSGLYRFPSTDGIPRWQMTIEATINN